MDTYLQINKALWDAKTPYHVQSEFYDNASFLSGRQTLNDIELNLLGDLRGKKVLHLQCHFGQDTLSLARLGAQVTGVDFSEKAIEQAKLQADQLSLDATFICADIYHLPEVLNEKFDIVFSSYGTIGWLPDIDKWASVIRHFLTDGGRFIFAEFHPVIWMFNNELTKITYSYFNKEAIVETEKGTYADSNADIDLQAVSWNHSLAEVLAAVLNQKLQITHFSEYDYSPYNCFSKTIPAPNGGYYIEGLEGKVPLVYALVAKK